MKALNPGRFTTLVVGALLAGLVFGWTAEMADAETIELVTFYPTEHNLGDLEVDTLLANQVGIGTDDPQSPLHVEGGSYALGGTGDVTGNGAVSTLDATRILQYLSGTTAFTPAQYAEADINGDGSVDRLDMELVLAVAVGNLTAGQAHHATGKRAADTALSATLTGDIGIGTVDPQARLHVVGQDDADSIAIFMPGTEGDGDGTISVGIGTEAPEAPLHVVGGIYVLAATAMSTVTVT